MLERDAPLEIMARRRDFYDGISLFIRQGKQELGMYSAEPITFKKCERAEMFQPFVTIDLQAAQQLMDELWQCGLRPSEGTGSAGSLRATENHLQDMRALVFKTPKPLIKK